VRGFASLAGLAVLLLLIPVPPVAAPHMGGTSLGPWVTLSGCPVGKSDFACTFTATASGPTFVFFRFDFNADGVWDFPNQVGGGSLGKWSTLTTVTWGFTEPFRRACVQVWDGVSTRTVDGKVVPRGPIGCTDFLSIVPRWWNRHAHGGWVLARLEVPAGLPRQDFDPSHAELEGIPAIPWPPGAGWGTPFFLFRVDRDALGALLGPGFHDVHLTVAWAGATFTATGAVTIL